MASQSAVPPAGKRRRVKYPTAGGLAPSPSMGGLAPSHSAVGLAPSPSARGGLTPSPSHVPASHKALITPRKHGGSQATEPYGPVRASRNYKVTTNIEMHSGYVGGNLVLAISEFKEKEDEIETIILSAKEYSALKTLYEEIVNEILPLCAQGKSASVSTLSVNDNGDLKVEIDYQSESMYVVKLMRVESDPVDRDLFETSVVEMDRSAFQNFDKAMKTFWFVFDRYPRTIQHSPGKSGELTRKLLERFALQMIHMIGEKYPECEEFGDEEFEDPLFRSAFFTSYAEMINLSLINSILEEFKAEYKELDLDMFTLAHQVLNQLDLLSSVMGELPKPKTKSEVINLHISSDNANTSESQSLFD
jgi:hypothetical protein